MPNIAALLAGGRGYCVDVGGTPAVEFKVCVGAVWLWEVFTVGAVGGCNGLLPAKGADEIGGGMFACAPGGCVANGVGAFMALVRKLSFSNIDTYF